MTEATKPYRKPPPPPATPAREAWLDKKAVSALTGLSTATVARKVAARDMPAPIRLGTRCTRWVAGEVLDWLAAKQQTRTAA